MSESMIKRLTTVNRHRPSRLHSQGCRFVLKIGAQMAAYGRTEMPKALSGAGCPLPNQLWGLGSVVSSPNRVQGRAPAANKFGAF